MKGLRLAVVVGALAGALVVSACGKGPRGKAGPTGTIAPAPQLTALSLPAITRNAVVTAYGANFASLTAGTAALPSVVVNGHQADVLSATGTTVTFTHAIPSDPTVWYQQADVVVVANNLASNPIAIQIVPPGEQVYVNSSSFLDAGGLSIAPNGDLINADPRVSVQNDYRGQLERIDAQGNIKVVPGYGGLTASVNGPQKAFDDGAGGYVVLDNSGDLAHYLADGSASIVARFPNEVDGTWDGTAFWAVLNSADAAVVVKWDATAHTTYPFARPNDGGNPFLAGAIARMGGSLYITDVNDGSIVAVDIGTGNSTTYAADASVPSPSQLTTDGTNLYLYSAGALTVVQNGGTVASYSTLHLDPGPQANGLAADSSGHVYQSSEATYPSYSTWIGRYSASGTVLEPWAARSYGDGWASFNGRYFDGSTVPSTTGGDVKTGILYESMADGSLRRVTNRFLNWDPYRSSEYEEELIQGGWMRYHGGKLWAVDSITGNVSSIDPDTGAVTPFFDNVTHAYIAYPTAIDFDAAGNGYVACYTTAEVVTIAKLGPTGTLATANFAALPTPAGEGNEIDALAVQGNRLVAFDSYDDELWTVPTATGGVGQYLGDVANNGDGSFYVYVNSGMYTDPATGNVVFADQTGDNDPYYYYDGTTIETLSPQNTLSTVILYDDNDGPYVQFATLDPSNGIVGSTARYDSYSDRYMPQHVMVLP